MKDAKFNMHYNVGETMKNIEEGQYNLDNYHLEKNSNLLTSTKDNDKVMVEKIITECPLLPHKNLSSVNAPIAQTKIITQEQPKTSQPLVDDLKNIKCAETNLCTNPIKTSRKRKNMFDSI